MTQPAAPTTRRQSTWYWVRSAFTIMPIMPRRARVAGAPDMNEVHRLAAEILLAELPPRLVRVVRMLDFVCWPFIAYLRLRQIETQQVLTAAEQTGRSPLRHRLETWWTCARLGLQPSEYYEFGIYLPGRKKVAGDFLPKIESLAIYRRLIMLLDRAENSRLSNKANFCETCRDRNIPAPQVLAVARGGTIDLREPLDGPAWAGDLIMKPERGSNGSGFYRWLRQDNGSFLGVLGERVVLGDILIGVRDRSRRRPIVMQRRLVNDAATERFTAGGLATVRVVTGRHMSGDIEVLAAAIKMPAGIAIVDNFMRGNVLAQIDPDTGFMTEGQSYYNRLTPVLHHPDTQARFAGVQVPQWEEIKRLAVTTHPHFPSFALIAFDIAPTPNGPVLVEGNGRGDLSMVQCTGGRPIGQTSYPSIILGRLKQPKR